MKCIPFIPVKKAFKNRDEGDKAKKDPWGEVLGSWIAYRECMDGAPDKGDFGSRVFNCQRGEA